jgi:hypothetical protein
MDAADAVRSSRAGTVMKPFAVALLLASAAGCAQRDPSLCCDAFSPTDDNGIYCNAHKDAVVRFVRDGRTPEEKRGRLEWFRGVLKEIEPLEDSDQIHDRLARFEKSRPEFWVQYDKQHFWAGRDTNLGLERRGRLMKCGFRHGIHAIELELAP